MPASEITTRGLDETIALMTALKSLRLRQEELEVSDVRATYRAVRALPSALDTALREIVELTVAGISDSVRGDALVSVTSMTGVLMHLTELHSRTRSESYALDGWPETI